MYAAIMLAAVLTFTACGTADAGPEADFGTELTEGSTEELTVAAIDPVTEAMATEPVTTEPATTEPETEATTAADTVPPVIEGVKELTVEVNSSISYKMDITVTDDRDPEPKLSVDNTAVDLRIEGDYPVVYYAEDADGNISAAETVVHVVKPTVDPDNEAEMRQLARDAVAECVSEDMSELEKLYNIFWYIKYNMKYVNESDKSNWVAEAIRGFYECYGDCFTYYSVARAMLDEAGFKTVDITRLGGETQHFWSMVCYNGEWYHFDTCPRSAEHGKYWYCFMRTDEEVEQFTEDWGEGYYYVYEKSLAPESAKEKLQHGYEINGEGHDGY